MSTYTFRAIKGRAHYIFVCACCGKPNRKRSFTVEHTVNPYNKNADGSVKTPDQVFRGAVAEAKAERDLFAQIPYCKSCEDRLGSADLKSLRQRRRKKLNGAAAA